MQYKTIVLELIQQFPELHERLKASRTLLSTLDRLASELKDSHTAWTEQLSRTSPGSEPQISSAALEMAINELETALLPVSDQDGEDSLTLDGAMASLRRPSHPG